MNLNSYSNVSATINFLENAYMSGLMALKRDHFSNAEEREYVHGRTDFALTTLRYIGVSEERIATLRSIVDSTINGEV